MSVWRETEWKSPREAVFLSETVGRAFSQFRQSLPPINKDCRRQLLLCWTWGREESVSFVWNRVEAEDPRGFDACYANGELLFISDWFNTWFVNFPEYKRHWSDLMTLNLNVYCWYMQLILNDLIAMSLSCRVVSVTFIMFYVIMILQENGRGYLTVLSIL